jgi:hypothetical protein
VSVERKMNRPVVSAGRKGRPERLRTGFDKYVCPNGAGEVAFWSQQTRLSYNPSFTSLGVRTLIHESKGTGHVTIRAEDAMRLRILNPNLETHRDRLLKRLAGARTFQRRWPGWLDAKVKRLIEDGLPQKIIRDTLLEEDDIYVKLRSIGSRRDDFRKSRRRDLDA